MTNKRTKKRPAHLTDYETEFARNSTERGVPTESDPIIESVPNQENNTHTLTETPPHHPSTSTQAEITMTETAVDINQLLLTIQSMTTSLQNAQKEAEADREQRRLQAETDREERRLTAETLSEQRRVEKEEQVKRQNEFQAEQMKKMQDFQKQIADDNRNARVESAKQVQPHHDSATIAQSNAIKMLMDDNWDEWSVDAEAVLTHNELWTCIHPEENTDKASESWKYKDKRARGFIICHVNTDLKGQIKGVTSAQEMWSLLSRKYEGQGNNKLCKTIQKLATLKEDTGSLAEIAAQFPKLRDKYRSVPKEDDTILKAFLINAIPDRMSEVRQEILSIPDRSLADSFEIVLDNVHRDNGSNSDKTGNLLFAKEKQHSSDKNTRCTNCLGRHEVKDCLFKPFTDEERRQRAEKFKKYRSGYNKAQRHFRPTNHRKSSNRNERKSDDSEQPKPKEGIKKGKLYAMRQVVKKGRIACAQQITSGHSRWFLDSGSTHHVCSDRSLFVTLEPAKGLDIVTANGDSLEIHGVGKCKFIVGNTEHLLADAVYAPKVQDNYLSLSRFLRRGCCAIFDNFEGQLLAKIYDSDELVFTAQLTDDNMFTVIQMEEGRLCAFRGDESDWQYWHRCLGHVNYAYLSKMKHLLDLGKAPTDRQCKECMCGKMHRLPFPSSSSLAEKPFELVYSDTSGKIRIPNVSNVNYFITFIDDYSRNTYVFFFKEKTDIVISEIFETFLNKIETKYETKIRALRTDNGTEYTNTKFQSIIKNRGIEHQFTIPNCPEMNGVAERMNLSINEGATTMLLDAKLKQSYWPHAVTTFVKLKNLVPCSAVGYAIPYNRLNKKNFNYSTLRPFGSEVIVYNEAKKTKFDATGLPGRLLSYSAKSKGYVILLTESKKIAQFRHVKFILPKNRETSSDDLESESEVEDEAEPESASESDDQTSAADAAPEREPVNEQPKVQASRENVTAETDCQVIHLTSQEYDKYVEENPTAELHPLPGRPKKIKTASGRRVRAYKYKIVTGGKLCGLRDKKEVDKILNGEEGHLWKQAMLEEYRALIEKNVWKLVDLPTGAKAIDSRWIFTKKRCEEGYTHKARFVAKGFSQVYGIDYVQTFAPVLRGSSVRLLIAHALQKNQLIHQLDVKTAYLHSSLEETIYLKPPYPFVEEKVCLLQKSIYGLKQSARQWYRTLSNILAEFNMQQLDQDECVFVSETGCLVVGSYVDDMIVLADDETIMNSFKKFISSKLTIKDKGQIDFFLGLKVRFPDEGITIDQSLAIEELAAKYQLDKAKPESLPIATGMMWKIDEDDVPLKFCTEYMSIVGSLLYIANTSRPDIQFAANMLCRFMANPCQKHIQAARRVVAYLNSTKHYRLKFIDSDSTVRVFCDADFANANNQSKSVSGIVVKVGENPIAWTSSLQSTIAHSTCEAELTSVKEACRDAVYYRNLIGELKDCEEEIVEIHNDNQSTIKTCEHGGKFNKVKHYRLRLDVVRECIDSGIVRLTYCPTEEQPADMLTKTMSKPTLQKCSSLLGMIIN